MHQFLTDQSLKEFLQAVKLPPEKKKEYEGLLPSLSEKGRVLLLDTLTKYYMLDYEEERTEKALALFDEFSKDYDYDKLKKRLEVLDNN